MKLYYEGGPRDGKVNEYKGKNPRGPRLQSCYDEAEAVGMFGIYQQKEETHGGATIMRWKELEPKKAT